ncbi:iron-containing redox enzyme family protein [Mycobacterium hodleri]|uniref:iron-containing redox enzyme family protein n=1 Tax=Mycolicibacterium hodleri TaxID=49897 RepID=UPI0021F2EDE5|nr:iron-containing redox enzyme family protein [Mycolicibacterium hodleri]MCV7137018.1 iron-containing redox enzyme family protein [Mycolicibacterium hodleri]
MTTPATYLEPDLPTAAGPLSGALIAHLKCRAPRRSFIPVDAPVGDSSPWGRDLQLALYVLYELHYRGFADVEPRWEWDPGVLHLRARLEDSFLAALQQEVGVIDASAEEEMAELSITPVDGSGLSYHLRDDGTWDQMREYFVHRSIYHLKEGDPHAWAIPRLSGVAKAAFVAVEFDEFGGGRADHAHQQLFGDLMDAAGLDSRYLHYLTAVPAEALAVVNVMSLFGLHREFRGAAVGHFAATEITSSPGSARLADALKKMKAPEACVRFYREHVEADAVHEQVVRTDVVADLVKHEPHLESDVVFGMRAFDVVESRLADHMMSRWTAGESSLRTPLS